MPPPERGPPSCDVDACCCVAASGRRAGAGPCAAPGGAPAVAARPCGSGRDAWTHASRFGFACAGAVAGRLGSAVRTAAASAPDSISCAAAAAATAATEATPLAFSPGCCCGGLSRAGALTSRTGDLDSAAAGGDRLTAAAGPPGPPPARAATSRSAELRGPAAATAAAGGAAAPRWPSASPSLLAGAAAAAAADRGGRAGELPLPGLAPDRPGLGRPLSVHSGRFGGDADAVLCFTASPPGAATEGC